MAIFKNKYTFGSVFSFKGNQYKVNKWDFETDDRELIEFLSNNSNWDLVVEKPKEELLLDNDANATDAPDADISKLSLPKLKELVILKGVEIPENADKKTLIKILEKK